MEKVKWFSATALTVAGALGINIVTDVTKGDIVAYHKLERATGRMIGAGDIVALTADGRAMERLCGLRLAENDLGARPINNVYYNSLPAILSTFTPSTLSRDLTFRGRYNEMRSIGEHSRVPMSEQCGCEVAKRVNRGEKVCRIQSSLSELTNDGDSTLAIRLANYSTLVPEAEFVRCGLPFSKQAHSALKKPVKCSGTPRYKWDVRLRWYFNLIKDREIVASLRQPVRMMPTD